MILPIHKSSNHGQEQFQNLHNLMSKFKNKKVIIVLPTWDNTYINKNVGKFIKILIEYEAEVSLFFREPEDKSSLTSIPSNAKYYSYNRTHSRIREFFLFLINNKFDLVWSYAGNRENILIALSKIIRGGRVIIKSDSKLFYSGTNIRSMLSRVFIFLIPGLLSDFILIESRNLEREAARWYPLEKIYYFPNGAPCRKFSEYAQKFKKESSPHPRKYVLFTGRSDYEKGIDLLIESFELIKSKFPEIDLIIVRTPWNQSYDEQCIALIQKLNLEGRVFMKPSAFDEDLARWYYFAEFFVLPSRNEGLPNRFPEAMYFNNPIVTFDVGQVSSMISELEGFIIPPEDKNQLAAAMSTLLSDNALLNRLALNAHKKIVSDYDDDKLFPDLFKKLATCLS